MKHGQRFVMNTGMMWMQVLFAINLDTLDMVCLSMQELALILVQRVNSTVL